MDRARPFYLAASAAVVLATSFGAGRILTIDNASTKAFEENPVAGVTVPTLPEEVAASAATTTSSVGRAASSSATSVPTATTPPTRAANVVCQWSARILAGGIPGPLPYGEADQFLVTVTNSSWADQPITIDRTFEVPAGRRPVSLHPPAPIVADPTGTASFAIPIGPESQGGAIKVLTQALSSDIADDICDWHEFVVDYNGPQGLVGGILASAAKNLLNLNIP